jgi:hypothetical protein
MGDQQSDARRLSAPDISHLRALGDLIRASPRRADRAQAQQVALGVAMRHRADGVTRAEIARYLGFPESTIRGWERASTAKPRTAAPHSRILPRLAPPGPSSLIRPSATAGTITQSSSQSATASISSSGSISAVAWARSPGVTTPIALARRVLVVSGDSRPGNNHFDPEAAAIRRLLSLTYVDVREIACPEPSEITIHLDRHLPLVLHVAAHASFGGVFLPGPDGRPVPVSDEQFATCVSCCRLKPCLVVLNFCESLSLARVLVTAVEAAIGWPGAVDDGQSGAYASQLYYWLAERAAGEDHRAVGDAHGLACKDTAASWPDLALPELCGSSDRRVFAP